MKNFQSISFIFILLTVLLTGQVILNQNAFARSEKEILSRDLVNQDDQTRREMERAANKIYHRGVDLFKKGLYWESAQELIILMDFYPQFDRLDKVVNYLGKCLFQEELITPAIRMFEYLIKKYPQSEHIPDALVGLEKAYYQQAKYKQALRFFYVILKRYPNNKAIIDEASYFAGQSHYYLKNYDMVINTLKRIDARSDYYDSALYTTALSYLKKSNVATSVDYFLEIVTLPIISSERRDIIDNARLTLGLIYYELKAYQASIYQLEKISDQHENYQDALLGMGWSYLKTQQYEKVINVLSELIEKFPGTANAEESYFLLGQSYIALGQYEEAVHSYKKIVELFPETSQVPNLILKVNNSLKREKNRLEELKVQILVEETKLLDAMPLDGYGKDLPDHLIKQKKRLREFRENMVSHLLNERDELLLMQRKIDDLIRLAERRQRRKDWRGYAEYGISRALFLKEMKESRGN